MNGHNPEALGPGEIKTSLAPSDQELAQAAVIEFFGAESRYPEHNERMIQKLDNFDLATPGLIMSVELHDIVDHGLVNPNNEGFGAKAQDIISELYKQVENKHEFLYALGCAISAATWESDVAEVWRHAGREQFPDIRDEDWDQVEAAIHKDRSEPMNEDVLKNTRVAQLDTSSLHDAMNDRDVEGLLIKAVELLDNLDNPPPNADSVWRDCVEILNCYGPALELFGFDELATQLNGEALKYFYDNPQIIEKSQMQHESSLRHLEEIQGKVPDGISDALKEVGDLHEIEDLAEKVWQKLPRVKTEGSMRKKFSSETYIDAEQLPDGIGYKVILLDYLLDHGEDAIDQIVIDIGRRIAQLTPHNNEEEDYINNPKKSGYKAYHVVLQYQINGDIVPVEIQVVSATQDAEHTYDMASHVLYKAGSEADEVVIRTLRAISRRAEQLRQKPNNQELKPQTWFEILKLLPDMETPIHKTFDLVELPNARILVADGIAEFAEEALTDFELEGDIVLPPSFISEEDFMATLKLLSPSLTEHDKVLQALEFAKSQDLGNRRDGVPVLEGHLLPAALHTAIMTSSSSIHWESGDSVEFLAEKVTEALLHDMVEDTEDDEAKAQMKKYIQDEYGNKIEKTVEAMSIPGHIKNTHRRRKAYAKKISGSMDALLVKPSDRGQNHVSDIVRMVTKNPDEEEMRKIIKYELKTMTYMNDLIVGDSRLPKDYVQTYKTVMKLLRHAIVQRAG